MTAWALAAVLLWLVMAAASSWLWLPRGWCTASRSPAWLVATVALLVTGTGSVAWCATLGAPTSGRALWLVNGTALVAAVLSGGALTKALLTIADKSARKPARVRRLVLQGGAWIGTLERLAVAAALLSRWPEGIAVIVAVKGLARFPELKTAQGTGASERFILGTFASLGWAATCAGVALAFR